MNSGTLAIIGSVIAFVVVFLIGKKCGKSDEKESALNTISQVAQDAATAKSEASAEVASSKAEAAQAKSEASKAETEKINSDMKATLANKLVSAVLTLVDKNEQSDETMTELQQELEAAKRYNNMEQVIDIARKQAARAVEMGMTDDKGGEE